MVPARKKIKWWELLYWTPYLDPTALFHVDLVEFYVGLEVPLTLDSFQGRSHINEKCLVCTGVPAHLEMVVLEGRDSVFNIVFIGIIGNWRVFA
jgi:hypothetical protein